MASMGLYTRVNLFVQTFWFLVQISSNHTSGIAPDASSSFPSYCQLWSRHQSMAKDWQTKLPVVEILQSLQLNLLVHSNKIFINDLKNCVRRRTRERNQIETTWTVLPGLVSASPTSTGRPWWLISRSSSFLFRTNFIRQTKSRRTTWEYPCMCGREPQWKEAGDWR